MKRQARFISRFLFTIGICTSSVFSLTGRVLESSNHEPVEGAKVQVVDEITATLTNSEGQFTIDPVAVMYGKSYLTDSKLYTKGNLLYVTLQNKARVALALFNAKGAKIGSKNLGRLEQGPHKLSINHMLPSGSKTFTGYLKLSIGDKFCIHKITRLSLLGEYEMRVSSPSFNPLAKGTASGSIRISMDKLNDTVAAFSDENSKMGDIVLSYPPRVLDVGAKPPYGAIVLFDGSKGQAAAQGELDTKWGPWKNMDGKDGDKTGTTFKVVPDPEFIGDAGRWTLQSCCHANWGYDDLVANEVHGDVQLHVEFNMLGKYDDDANPDDNNDDLKGGKRQPGYTNSGVYVQNRFEIQVVSTDNRANITGDSHHMASLVDQKAPDSDEWRDNGEWQAYDITFRTSRWAGDTKTSDAYITVYWNGVKVHDNVEALGPASGGHSGEPHDGVLWGLKLQSEAKDCRYRNIWMKHLTIEDAETDFGY